MRIRIPHVLIPLAVLILVSGCATIIEGTTEELSFDSDPPGADCTLNRNNQTIASVKTPGSVSVKKTKYDIDVTCKKDGYQDASAHLESDFAAATVGNVALGGVIGVMVDSASGASNKYSEHTKVVMIPGTTGPVAGPASESRDSRIAQLRESLDRGAISAADYQRLRREAESNAPERIAQLRELLDRGAISAVDYQDLRREIDGNNPAPQLASNSGATASADPDSLLWNRIKDSTNPNDFQAYLTVFPNGAFASIARDATKPAQVVSTPAGGTSDEIKSSSVDGDWTGSGHQPCEWSGKLTVRNRQVTGAITVANVEAPINTTLQSDGSLSSIVGGFAGNIATFGAWSNRSIEGHLPDLVFGKGNGGSCSNVYMTFTKNVQARDTTKSRAIAPTTAGIAADASEATRLAGKWTANVHQPCESSGTLNVRDQVVTGSIQIDEVEMPINTTLQDDGAVSQMLNWSQSASGPTSRFAGGRYIEGQFPNLVVGKGQNDRCHDVYLSFSKVGNQT